MKNILLRYFFFALGLAINSFGIAFITKSALGTSQISSVPYVLSLQFPSLSFGMTTFIFNMLFIACQVALLRRDFAPIQFLQIFANILFSTCIDISMGLLDFFQPELLIVKFLSMIFGCMILAFGICIEVAPNVIVVPGEGIVRAIVLFISMKRKVKFGTVKIVFDVSLIIIATIMSFVFFNDLIGVGIGTIMSALTVGKFINIINDNLTVLNKIRALAEKH